MSGHEALTKSDDVNEMIDWQVIEHLLCDIRAKRRRNAAWPPLFMFKAPFLPSCCSLSHPRLKGSSLGTDSSAAS